MRRRERSGPSGRDYSCVGPTRYGPAGVFYGPPVASSARELFMLGGSWGYGPAVIFYGPPVASSARELFMLGGSWGVRAGRDSYWPKPRAAKIPFCVGAPCECMVEAPRNFLGVFGWGKGLLRFPLFSIYKPINKQIINIFLSLISFVTWSITEFLNRIRKSLERKEITCQILNIGSYCNSLVRNSIIL